MACQEYLHDKLEAVREAARNHEPGYRPGAMESAGAKAIFKTLGIIGFVLSLVLIILRLMFL